MRGSTQASPRRACTCAGEAVYALSTPARMFVPSAASAAAEPSTTAMAARKAASGEMYVSRQARSAPKPTAAIVPAPATKPYSKTLYMSSERKELTLHTSTRQVP